MLNSVSIMGRFTANPELRHTPSGVAVTSFTLAVDKKYAKQGGERGTDFFDFVAWRTNAEFICKYFTKGNRIAIEGHLQTREYEDKEGKKRKITEVVVDNSYFCESKGSSSPKASAGIESGQDDYVKIEDDGDLPWDTKDGD